MKRHIRREVLERYWRLFGTGVCLGIVTALVIHTLILNNQPIRYVQAYEEPEPKVVQIAPHIEWTPERILEEVHNTFPENPQLAEAVMMGESELNPNAYNPEWHYDRHGNPVCQGSYGLMQIACVHVENTDDLYDVEYNLKVARAIYDDSGWRPWGAYTSGGYIKFLK